MNYRLWTLAIVAAIAAAVLTCVLAAWAWSEYVNYIERMPLTPIPVPTPP